MAVIQGGNIIEPGFAPIYRNAGAPVNGTSGTLFGVAEPGDLLVDTTNKRLYQNTNTKASPLWTPCGLQIWTNAGAPTNGTTLANVAAKGDLLTDTTNAILYINTNTLASPTWTKVGTQT
ncbi:hypothetical protein [Bacteriophage sp.]|nr:hypothetical protein [Bacteriophage sp.]